MVIWNKIKKNIAIMITFPDIWIGYFTTHSYIYICLIPLFMLSIKKNWRVLDEENNNIN
jgi:hypothetical protein